MGIDRPTSRFARMIAGCATVLTLALGAQEVAAQDVAQKANNDVATELAAANDGRIYACYIPRFGSIYRIKAPGLRNRCFSRRHIEFSWEIEGKGGGGEPGPQASSLTRFEPAPDWTRLARGFGVPAARVERCEELARELDRALAEPGPHLIEVVI